MMKKLPAGIQTIRKILEQDYLYVDKTLHALKLIEGNSPYYFMSRPRRFGKSLFLDTLAEIFAGEKELFKECEIYNRDYDWREYSVLRFDFYNLNTDTPQSFIQDLKDEIKVMAVDFGLGKIEGQSVEFLLKQLIRGCASKSPVVILVDEYDHAIVNKLDDREALEANKQTLRSFFGTIKSLDRYIKFSFVTGVTKFSQTTLFSGPNQYTDITFLPEYAETMGYTHGEVLASFDQYIAKMAQKRLMSESAVVEEMRSWYNGYRFSEDEASVYNPYSTILYFSSLRNPKGYWYNSATPCFFFKQITKYQSLADLTGPIRKMESSLSNIVSTDRIDLIALMFQAGYLTIKKYQREYDSNIFDLDFPNKEVKGAFSKSLLKEMTHIEDGELGKLQYSLKSDIESGNLSEFFNQIYSVFSEIPYQLTPKKQFESTYHSILLALLLGSNISVQAEVSVGLGRIDLVVHTEKVIYLLELKRDKSANEALLKIKHREYAGAFTSIGKKIILLGVNFSTEKKNIEEWKSEEFSNH